ncbi:MAG: hypothetical protein ISR65_12250 [Bacteriovoracaceae bacterium]|nr:hypothetical protein [Bacteriovoracaceae bacterium]
MSEEQSFVQFDTIKNGSFVFVNQPLVLTGVVSLDIKEVQLWIDGKQMAQSIPKSGDFVINIEFIEVGYMLNLELIAYNDEGRVIAAKNYLINAILEPLLSLTNVEANQKFSINESVVITGTADPTLASVELVLSGASIGEIEIPRSTDAYNFSFNHTFDSLGDNLSLAVRAYNNYGHIVKKVSYNISVVDLQDITDEFDIAAPTSDQISRNLSLWATYYYLPRYESRDFGIPLRDLQGDSLGPMLTNREWCMAAMEGSVNITMGDNEPVTYNYAGTSSGYEVNCSAYFSHNVSRTKFRHALGPYGDGIGQYKLVPYRTIAVDKNNIAYGSVVYIPAARGTVITLPNGSNVTHDGYFFAGDTGGVIKNSHIDVFIGISTQNPFSWVTSSSSNKFDAKIINDSEIIDRLMSKHNDL